MKTIILFSSLLLACTIMFSCGSKDYNNQPWMPSKTKSKSNHGHGGHKKAQYYQHGHNNF